MSRGRPLKWKLVPLDQIGKLAGVPADEPIGSEYDSILRALQEHPLRAVQILTENSIPLGELTPDDRDRIRSGLKQMSNNRRIKIETRITSDAVFGWLKPAD